MRRRDLLKGLVAGAVGAVWPRPARADDSGTDRPHVIVVGGGPAGLSAALELAERGVRVTLLEAGDALGGKVRGWHHEVNGETVDAEHGIHGVWHQYVHMKDLLGRHGVLGALRPHALAENGMRTPDAVVESYRRKVRHIARRAREKGYRLFSPQWTRGMRWVRDLTPEEALRTLAGRSVTDWLADPAPLTVFTVFDEMMAYSMYFVGPGDVDAAVFALGERFYFSGGPYNDRVHWMRGNPQTLLWEPLGERVEGFGGTIRLRTPAAGLIVEDGQVVGVRIGTTLAATVPPVDAWTAVDVEGERLLVGREDGRPAALSGRCTHMGCPVNVAPDGFLCPCHGGRFDAKGVPVAGPPKDPLRRLAIEEAPEGWRVVAERTEELRADAVVVAVDGPAFARLAGDLVPNAQGLKGTRETVARFWFDRDVDPDARPAILLDGFPHASNGFLVHRLQDAARDWASRTGGSVVEIQAYKDVPEGPPDAILDAIERDARAIWPELAEAKVLDRTLTDGRTFTWFYPGWWEAGVPVEPGVPGLYVAGDFVRIEQEAQFMELAVLSGRLAANAILAAHGLPTAPILPPL